MIQLPDQYVVPSTALVVRLLVSDIKAERRQMSPTYRNYKSKTAPQDSLRPTWVVMYESTFFNLESNRTESQKITSNRTESQPIRFDSTTNRILHTYAQNG